MALIDVKLLLEYLPKQRWFGAKDKAIDGIDVVVEDVLRDPFPMLLQVLADVDVGDRTAMYQLLVGVRAAGEAAEFLHGSDDALLGEIATAAGPGFAYDATLDHQLGLELLGIVAPGEDAHLVRPIAAEQSNSSLVFDDRLIMKVFRQLEDGPNPDVEVTTELAARGFEHVARPVARWQRDGRDLAFVQQYLAGGTDGWSLALTSLRDVLAEPCDPAEAGGDLAGEAGRLGVVTAELHVAMTDAFGRYPGRPDEWAAPMRAQLARTRHPELDEGRVRGLLDRLGSVPDVGPAIRIHGDYHLGQVMRTDAGWYILDFEGEPARPLAERTAPTSPLKDVAGMLRSFHYAAQVALRERGTSDPAEEWQVLVADEWEQRNRQAFLDGYLPVAGAAELLPPNRGAIDAVLAAFELDKAVYELAYEQANRPSWVEIPLSAIRRILEANP